jgi:hypothetical protein
MDRDILKASLCGSMVGLFITFISCISGVGVFLVSDMFRY